MIALKKEYGCICSLVFHGIDYSREFRSENTQVLLQHVDAIGFRSLMIQKEYLKAYSPVKNHFICYSGINHNFIGSDKPKEFNKSIKEFLFVGMLLKRKNVDSILKMFSKINQYEDGVKLDIVGSGPESKNLMTLSKKLGINESISFSGHIDRNKVLSKMDNAECFIMISRDEAFGLVYLEAMAKGCLVVAAKDEGMDGLIEDKKNGFLCNAGDEKELLRIVGYINALTVEEKKCISNNAINAVRLLTETEVSKNYLQNVLKK